MSQIEAKPLYTYQGMSPSYNLNQPANMPVQQVQTQSPNYDKQLYQYPQSSIYNQTKPNSASGVNIVIYNPTGMGNQCCQNPCCYPMPYLGQVPQQLPQAQIPSQPIASTPVSSDKSENNDNKNTDITVKNENTNKKTKKIVKLTDDYIKTLESFLRSQDKSVRKQGIQDLLKRFEEDDSRYDNPSLTALLNIALQDPDTHNRVIALSIIASGSAHGDYATIELLNELKNSKELYGQEAKLATTALLKTSQIQEKVIDNNADFNNAKKPQNEIDKMYE